MEKSLRKYITGVEKLNDWAGGLAGVLTVAMMLLICFDVLAKWLSPKIGIHYSNTAIFELQWHIFAVIFMLGSAYTLKNDRHVRVDVFYSNFSDRQKAWVNLVGTLLFLLPFCYIAMETSILYVKNSFLMNEKSSDPGGLPYRFIIKGMIILGFLLLALQGTALIFRSIIQLTEKKHLLR